MRTLLISAAIVLGASSLSVLQADEPLFSGPQVGEKLPAFTVIGVFDDDAGKDLDFVGAAKGKPIVLIFVHELNRPSIGMTRTLATYTHSRAEDGLRTGVVWLEDDATAAENTLKRIRHALAPGAPIGISPDGREGPGSYGLNRNVSLTILIGNEGKVTANFALVQPSLQADLPKILEKVVEVAGGKVPKLEEITGAVAMGDRQGARPAAGAAQDPNLRGLLVPVIQKTATPAEVDKAAKRLEEYLVKNEATRKEVGRIANTIIDAGKLENYGTARAQEYLQKWAREYGKPAGNPAEKPDKPTEKSDTATDGDAATPRDREDQ